jgi:citrate lyase beta subunit
VLDAISLGATLYLPATRPDLGEVASGIRYPQLRSAAVCLEDSVSGRDVPRAMANVARLLEEHRGPPGRPRLFIRPRDPAMLSRLLRLPGIEAVDGFVIPKATADSLPQYLRELEGDGHLLMPTLETREAFYSADILRLRDQLLGIQGRVLAIRIGGNDLLQTIGARRSSVRTLYEGPLGPVVAGLVAAFAPFGFALSSPVFEHFQCEAVLREEVERDIEHGLLTKTAIHPRQVSAIQGVYAVEPAELAEARAILAGDSPAVFALGESMCEPATHRRWAEATIRRAECFGLRRDSVAAIV